MTTNLSIEDQVIVALRRINRAIDLHSKGLVNEIGLTAPQLATLLAVRRLHPITVGALAKSVHLSQATMTGILNRLEKRELVERTRSGNDRRSVVVELTRKGDQLVEAAPSLLQDRFRRELLTLREWEQTQMLSTLQRIASMMDAEDIDASPVLAVGEVSQTTPDTIANLEQQPSEGHLATESSKIVKKTK